MQHFCDLTTRDRVLTSLAGGEQLDDAAPKVTYFSLRDVECFARYSDLLRDRRAARREKAWRTLEALGRDLSLERSMGLALRASSSEAHGALSTASE